MKSKVKHTPKIRIRIPVPPPGRVIKDRKKDRDKYTCRGRVKISANMS